jgi:hypothetical protein
MKKKYLKIFNFIIREDGLILVCHNKFNLNKNFFKENKIDKKFFDKVSGFFEYGNNIGKIVFFNKIKDLEWIIVT